MNTTNPSEPVQPEADAHETLEDEQADAPPQRFHIHMALAHIPCGAFVTSFVLCLLEHTPLREALGRAAAICFLVGAAAVPLVIASGVITWKRRRNAGVSAFFRVKLVWGILLVLACVATAGPELARTQSPDFFAAGVAISAVLAFMLARMGTAIVLGRIGLPDEPARRA